jgi:hypothetical protein
MLGRARNDAAGASIADPLFGALETGPFVRRCHANATRSRLQPAAIRFRVHGKFLSAFVRRRCHANATRSCLRRRHQCSQPQPGGRSPPCHANELRRSRLQLSSPERTVRGRAFARRRISAHGAASRAPGHERGRAARHTPEFEERELWLRMFRMDQAALAGQAASAALPIAGSGFATPASYRNFAFSPSSTRRRMASDRLGLSICFAAQASTLFRSSGDSRMAVTGS